MSVFRPVRLEVDVGLVTLRCSVDYFYNAYSDHITYVAKFEHEGRSYDAAYTFDRVNPDREPLMKGIANAVREVFLARNPQDGPQFPELILD